MRNFRILKNQAKGLSCGQCFNLLKTVLFVNKTIEVYSQILFGSTANVHALLDGATIEKGDISILSLEEQKMVPLPWEYQCHKYDAVKDFFIVKGAEGIRHISWIYLHNQRNRILSLAEDEAEIKFSLTLPNYRGQGLYPKVLCAIMDHLYSTGIKRVFICAERNNLASIRGIEKAGFKKAGEVRLRKILGVQVSSRLDTKRIE